MLPGYTPIPEEAKGLSVVKNADDIPKTITGIASGRIKYQADRKKLERFDVNGIGDAFGKLLRLPL